MKHVVIGAALFAAGGALGVWLGGVRAAESAAPGVSATVTPSASAPAVAPEAAASAKPRRQALQAWEGCRPIDTGAPITGPATHTLALADGSQVQVSLVPATRDNGTLVFDTLVKGAAGSVRSQVGFQSTLLAEGVLLRVVDLDEVQREVSGGAAYLAGPHPMAR